MSGHFTDAPASELILSEAVLSGLHSCECEV